MYVADASLWVAKFVINDFYHTASYKWLEQQISLSEVVASPAILLPEVGGAVARRTGDTQLGAHAIAMMRQLPNLQLVSIDVDLAGLSADRAANLRLRGADSLYVALPRRLNVPLVTWDREQLERGSAAVTPEAALG